MKKVFLLLIITLLGEGVWAQDTKKITVSPDLHFRTFWMSTTYPDDFRDDYALGASLNIGGKLVYEGFQLHAGYRVFGNLVSSDIWERDPESGRFNRYETGLFDLLNPGDDFFGKLEILNVSYKTDKWGVQIGRFGINTSWINPQDGRLSPTGVEGGNVWFAPNSAWRISAWFINRMSVRGTSQWLGIGESIGVYPKGRDEFGNPSAYFGNTDSDFISIFEISRTTEKLGKVHFNQTLTQNIFNTITLDWQKSWEVKEGAILTGGIQAGFQHGIGTGGAERDDLRYKNPKDANGYLSLMVSHKRKGWTNKMAFTYLDGNGRWLSPREWGKDPWFTFIPRERNEGFESVLAGVYSTEYSFPDSPFSIYAMIGLHRLPDINDAMANKYNFPSYRQLNFGAKYQPFKSKRSGIHLLVMNKEALGNDDLTSGQRYNKVEMWHVNVMINYYLTSFKP